MHDVGTSQMLMFVKEDVRILAQWIYVIGMK